MAARDWSLSRGSKWVRALPAKYQFVGLLMYTDHARRLSLLNCRGEVPMRSRNTLLK